ncbi:MAG: hypothetical protein ACRECF_05515 [Methyloceanibacter sp.]
MLTADRESCAQGEWRPGRLWSLLDMLRFYADRFVNQLNLLNTVESLLNNPEKFFSVETNAPFAADSVQALMEILASLDMNVSWRKARQLHLLMTQKANATMGLLAKRYCEELRERIEHELEGKAIYFVSCRVELLESSTPLFGVEVFDAFPSANDDIAEAAACLALGRATACVMHLMRACEVGLKALGARLSVGPQNDWGSYLREIDKALNERVKQHDIQTHQEQFFAEAAASFDHLKRAWRNPTMHVERTYTPERAEAIFEAVRSFMQHLATGISEPTPPSMNALVP